MNRLYAVLVVLTLCAMTGCGDGDEAADSPSLAKAALLTPGELPQGASERPSLVLGAPCGPMPIMRNGGASVAEGPMYVVRKVNSQQVVGIFATAGKARVALDSLASPSRYRCILKALRGFGRQRGPAGLSIKRSATQDPDAGDEARAIGFVIDQPGAASLSYVDTVTIRTGRAVTEMIFLANATESRRSLIREIAGQAADRIAGMVE